MISTVASCGGRCDFVRFICSEEELLKRVANDERRLSRKIADINQLKDIIHRYDIHNVLRSRECLTIDTTILSPELSSRRILEYFKIGELVLIDR